MDELNMNYRNGFEPEYEEEKCKYPKFTSVGELRGLMKSYP